MHIPFNSPHVTGRETEYIRDAVAKGHLSSSGPFSRLCEAYLEKFGSKKALLTHTCTDALEMAAILAEIGPGDEVIMPSFTFVSTANAFVLRGAVPVFVDVRRDTLNIDENQIRQAITPRTKAIVVVHYAGVAAEMDAILSIAESAGLFVIEDAAQGVMCSYKGRALGTMGHLGAFSFHETKNVISGEGGALLVNDPRLVERAEVIAEKGTDRRKFLRGMKSKYEWVDIGSSFLASEITAAFLWAQLERAEELTNARKAIWNYYQDCFSSLEMKGIAIPTIPSTCDHNAHIYYLLFPSFEERSAFIKEAYAQGVETPFHYVPLHSAPAGRRYGRLGGPLSVTDDVSSRIVRLPIWIGIEPHLAHIVETIDAIWTGQSPLYVSSSARENRTQYPSFS